MDQKVLIIEDDRDLINLLDIHLSDLNVAVEKAFDGENGLTKALTETFDLIILDLMLPKLEGFEVCRRIRETDKVVPILMLTSKSEELDKIVGLELGANDYITKPFSIRELMARVKTNLRSVNAVKENFEKKGFDEFLSFPGLQIERSKRKVVMNDKVVELTAKEFELLTYFASHPGRSFTREELLTAVWGYQFEGYDHTVNSHINRLRAKIEMNPSEPRFIKTVWGVGYRFAEKEELEQ